MFVNTAVRSVARVSSKRPMSTAAPKMHKAKDVWGELKATRPPAGHDHVSLDDVRIALRILLMFPCTYPCIILRLHSHLFHIVFICVIQTVFEPPYNPFVVGAAVSTVLVTGYGLMYFGMRHQQYKQGYWK
ncbi:hypothetical protein HJC23_000333 [Cyclotella cryptica]|uniref:Uncharacterized protein n=1 Tax=Cyclotella cryptica TaxID=29204 RepID=A0ABD3NIY7_9STRA